MEENGTLLTSLDSQINITRIVEIRPNSSLLVVCRMENLPPSEYERIAKTLEEKISSLLEGGKVVVVIGSLDFELDFYRLDRES